jgi:hypothetical protein
MARSSCDKDTPDIGHICVVGSANGAKALSDQRRDVGVRLGDCPEHLPTSACCFEIADAHSR